jgi:hypothetical protein
MSKLNDKYKNLVPFHNKIVIFCIDLNNSKRWSFWTKCINIGRKKFFFWKLTLFDLSLYQKPCIKSVDILQEVVSTIYSDKNHIQISWKIKISNVPNCEHVDGQCDLELWPTTSISIGFILSPSGMCVPSFI